MTEFFILMAFIASAVFSVIVGVGIITYIRRTWQLIRADHDGSTQDRILDGLDQLQTQLYSMSERLERLEQGLQEGDRPPSLPPANDERPPEVRRPNAEDGPSPQ